jgi:hypothetical protein
VWVLRLSQISTTRSASGSSSNVAAALKYARRSPKAGGGVFQVGRYYPVEDGDLHELHA